MNAIAQVVSQLQPGQCIRVSRHELQHTTTPLPGWTAAEWILENIVGSAYELQFYENPVDGDVTFRRLPRPLDGNDGVRTYVSADRRHLFVLRPDGLFAIA